MGGWGGWGGGHHDLVSPYSVVVSGLISDVFTPTKPLSHKQTFEINFCVFPGPCSG